MIKQTDIFKGEKIVKNKCIEGVNIKVKPLIKEFGGYSFNNGLFRIHTFESCIKWTQIIEEYFINYKGSFALFGFDWMGRQFAINLKNESEIYIFDITVFKKYICDETLEAFLNNISINTEDYFSESLFKMHNVILNFNECISHKIPLMLGGEDINSNMEVTNMEVDWGIVGQLHQQI